MNVIILFVEFFHVKRYTDPSHERANLEMNRYACTDVRRST
jgi:hypothetical protein